MSKIYVEYYKERVTSPLSFWVHKAVDSQAWLDAKKYDPPMPKPTVGKGYPKYQIEYRGHILFFISKEEITHCIDILSQKVLPTTRALANDAGYPDWQHIHWLSKWPGDIKSWKDRQRIVQLLEELLNQATE